MKISDKKLRLDLCKEDRSHFLPFQSTKKERKKKWPEHRCLNIALLLKHRCLQDDNACFSLLPTPIAEADRRIPDQIAGFRSQIALQESVADQFLSFFTKTDRIFKIFLYFNRSIRNKKSASWK